MGKKLSGLVLVALLLTSFAALTRAQDGIATQRVQFAHGSSSSTVKGAIQADVARDYVLGAKAGQTMSVKLETTSNLYFNVLPPKSEEALFVGKMVADGENWSGKLPADGDYTIRVYAMGDAKQGNHPFTGTISIK